MAEIHGQGRSDSWLQAELSRQLAPVAAPESLWRQIHEQRRPLRVRQARWAEWSFAALALVVLSGGAFRQFGMTRGPVSVDLEKLAAEELRGVTPEFRSSDPREIQAWVKSKSNIDIRLPDRAVSGTEEVRMIGARMIRMQGVSVAAVTYSLGDDVAAILVTDRNSVFSGKKHVFRRAKSSGETPADTRFLAFSMGREDYTIAFAGAKDPQRACLLCHAEPAGLVVSN